MLEKQQRNDDKETEGKKSWEIFSSSPSYSQNSQQFPTPPFWKGSVNLFFFIHSFPHFFSLLTSRGKMSIMSSWKRRERGGRTGRLPPWFLQDAFLTETEMEKEDGENSFLRQLYVVQYGSLFFFSGRTKYPPKIIKKRCCCLLPLLLCSVTPFGEGGRKLLPIFGKPQKRHFGSGERGHLTPKFAVSFFQLLLFQKKKSGKGNFVSFFKALAVP